MLAAELHKAWEQVVQRLQKKINTQSFDHWIKPLKPVTIYGNTVFIEVPNHFSRDWLLDRYAAVFKQAFERVLGHDVAVQFLLTAEVPQVLQALTRLKTGPQERFTYLNPKYTFDTFVVGNSNRFAHAAALAVADGPARAYNPLFVYGGVGLGKTHLMHAIGHHILARAPYLNVAYVTSEHFTNELINAIRDDDMPGFRRRYRNIDILLIDDIQFLAGKERTQEEFFHTFNTLYEAAKQIVISSDRPPKDIPTLEDRLRSRFEWGLIADIQPPDFETRVAILRKKAQLDNVEVPDETLHYIADRIQSNIRELEGAFIRVVAFASLTQNPITPEMAADVLKDIISPKAPRPITCQLIQEAVSDYFQLKPEDLKAKKRTRNVAFPRQLAMYLTRELTDMSLPKIGEEFGGRDHTTVIHAYEKISQELQHNPSLQELVNELINRLNKI